MALSYWWRGRRWHARKNGHVIRRGECADCRYPLAMATEYPCPAL